ncbi:MAG TPA: UDP-N-acetylmuramoyl-L-alanyl-D-glutamate--2,6-diaminopimelate ligase [Chromatiaceae bacterium]|jgi:UDP-N-acetylmuramoyl-L-alanyl-D-glutamate--2,6-diaminopimelate ligase|nr:UDP-N-acetylmuramoyl-L-alanyl-D-glutamate--2,6-diaminopimelate ligase [Chromatiaceae bacterium]HIA08521.1 UDP-N-acetylmuramoyl-L-alanyl-D-glutamate--2,6-diaminopimelate ligase [Chromatiaceae bacterium]HIN82156.1 UDP-N-acetylmuramoyl-L-alanyl-D-glutamate--2,6-diaminopimelate ligase [Chromatiales bacterium]HIO54966.1 UDP-N-acetylmuramoyl-L-alanyl-D-glutamate--2,6-diaminopimelate ligase [Chromatiales bacterium]
MMAIKRASDTLDLAQLLDGFAEVPVDANIVVSGLASDSRRLLAGDIFIACAGIQTHGLDFAAVAIDSGAAAILWEPDARWDRTRINQLCSAGVALVAVDHLSSLLGRIGARFYDHPSHDLEVIAVTGTNGKTSVCQFIAQALAAGDPLSCATIGTLGYGVTGALQAATHTTPDALTLQSLLAGFRNDKVACVAMEASSHGLAQHRLQGTEIDIAVFTNLTRDHLDYHATMDAYGEAKKQLFIHPGLKTAVINLDDDFGRELIAALPDDVEQITYGLNRDGSQPVAPDLCATHLQMGSSGLSFDLHWRGQSAALQTGLLGRFNAHNLMAAFAALLAQGIAFDDLLHRFGSVASLPGRMERFSATGKALVVVDFAHTPDALQQVLKALRHHCAGSLWVVFGCGGNRDAGKRPLMATVAEQYADQIVITDDNPRLEDGDQIVTDIVAGLTEVESAHIQRDRAGAIAYAVTHAAAGDLILVAGKGHETTQQLGELKIPFSDRDVVNALLGSAESAGGR